MSHNPPEGMRRSISLQDSTRNGLGFRSGMRNGSRGDGHTLSGVQNATWSVTPSVSRSFSSGASKNGVPGAQVPDHYPIPNGHGRHAVSEPGSSVQMALHYGDNNPSHNNNDRPRQRLRRVRGARRQRSRIYDDPAVIAGYNSVPLIELDRLPRGGISLDTKAVGRIQVRQNLHAASQVRCCSLTCSLRIVWNSTRNHQGQHGSGIRSS